METMTRSVGQLLFSYLPDRTVNWEDGAGIVRLGIPRLKSTWAADRARFVLNEVERYLAAWKQRHGLVDRFPPTSDEHRFSIGEPAGIDAFPLKTALYCRDCFRFLPRPPRNAEQLRCPDCHKQSLRQMSYVFVHGCGELVPIADTIPIESPKYKGTIFDAPIRCAQCGHDSVLRLDARSDRLSALEIRCDRCKSEVIGRFLARCPRCFPRLYRAADESAMGQLAFRAAMRITRHSANNAYYPHSITILRLDRPLVTQQSEEQRWLESLLPADQQVQATGVSQSVLAIAERLRLAEKQGDAAAKVRLLEELARTATAADPSRAVESGATRVPVLEDVSKSALESLALLSRVRRSTVVVAHSSPSLREGNRAHNVADTIRALGIRRIEHVSDLPVISATFGYSRRSATATHREERAAEDFPTTLRPFHALDDTAARIAGNPQLVGTVPILAREGEHEGLALYLDPTRVLGWLEANGAKLSGASTEERRLSLLQQLEPIDAVYQQIWAAPNRRLLFGLLHTMSHCAMKALASTAGLETTSVSEYIFLPLFCTVVFSTATVELGGVRSTALERMAEFSDTLQEHSNRCLYDPDCINRTGACHGCIHVPELTCRTFNHGLSRAFLAGGRAPWSSPGDSQHLLGYWQYAAPNDAQ